MASYSRKLKDSSGNYVIPVTRSSCVYMSDDTLLEEYLNTKFKSLEDKIQSASLLSIYPVGAVYQSTNATSPASLFGGSWTPVQNQFLLGSGSRGVGTTGGEENHVLNQQELPALRLWIATTVRSSSAGIQNDYGASGDRIMTNRDAPNTTVTHLAYVDTGGWNQAHNNMPPFYTVNIWRRVS